MIYVGIIGASGKMGRALIQEIAADPSCQLSAAIVSAQSPHRRQPVAHIPLLYTTLSEAFHADVLIDFSHPTAACAVIEKAVELKIPLVIGTTGHSETEIEDLLARASESIPVLAASNFSLGIQWLKKFLDFLPEEYRSLFQLQLLDIHHAEKKDAPSGTALSLKKAWGKESQDIPIQSVRTGSIVGEHHIWLHGKEETLHIEHRAHSRQMFAKGALLAAKKIVDLTPNRYDFGHVIFSKVEELCKSR